MAAAAHNPASLICSARRASAARPAPPTTSLRSAPRNASAGVSGPAATRRMDTGAAPGMASRSASRAPPGGVPRGRAAPRVCAPSARPAGCPSRRRSTTPQVGRRERAASLRRCSTLPVGSADHRLPRSSARTGCCLLTRGSLFPDPAAGGCIKLTDLGCDDPSTFSAAKPGCVACPNSSFPPRPPSEWAGRYWSCWKDGDE